MVGNVFTYATLGIDAIQLSVECDASGSTHNVNIVGMATRAVQESKDRIFAALRNSAVSIPTHPYTINLAPADIKKDSAALDLPVAIAVMQAIRQLPVQALNKTAIIGELSLDGTLRPSTVPCPSPSPPKETASGCLSSPQKTPRKPPSSMISR